MKIFTAALTGVLALSWIADAGAQQRRNRDRQETNREWRDPGYYKRPSTVDSRGLCQRDNGRPLDKLNLNQTCDREEFWDRMRDRYDVQARRQTLRSDQGTTHMVLFRLQRRAERPLES